MTREADKHTKSVDHDNGVPSRGRKELSLKKETLRNLTPDELREVAGGCSSTSTCVILDR